MQDISEDIRVIYDDTQNPAHATLPGVPLADMTAAEFAALPAWLKRSVQNCSFYSVPDSLREPEPEPEPESAEPESPPLKRRASVRRTHE